MWSVTWSLVKGEDHAAYSIMKRCTICNARIWPWYYLYRAGKFDELASWPVRVCKEECYVTLFMAYEEGLQFVYVDR